MLFFSKNLTPKTLSSAAYLFLAFKTLAILGLLFGLVFLPYAAWWLAKSGDVAVERAVSFQAQGNFGLFGSGVSQDFVDYKLKLYEAVKPSIVAIGSSRVMQFREKVFTTKFLNMGGVAGNLPVLRSTIDAMLKVHTPQAVILGLDFWWFMPTWNRDPFQEEPPTSGSYSYSFQNLLKPWVWFLTGKINFKELAAPLLGLFGHGFRTDRFGIMAQQTDDGFGSDGSWYYTAEITGQKKPFDYQFQDTMTQVVFGSKAFYHAPKGERAPAQAHLDALAEIYCRLQSRGIRTFVFIAPLSERVYQAMRAREAAYPHLFNLAFALQARGINVLDLSNPKTLGSSDCEFVDGFHGGEVTYLRVLRSLADQWSALLNYVNFDEISKAIAAYKGHALVYDAKLTQLLETDFMDFGCPKRKQAPVTSGTKVR